jgi:hypothetical protein
MEFLAICSFFMAVQAVEGFFHQLQAVCNGFVDYET